MYSGSSSFLVTLIFWGAVVCKTATASQKHIPESLEKRATSLKVWEHSYWRKLLYYRSHSSKSLIDSPSFFLSPRGKKSTSEELFATLNMFFSPPGEDHNKHAQCLFPLRLKWLKNILMLDSFGLPTISCKALNNWKRRQEFQKVSLVFSSYYANNPASMFGHTFLQLHRHDPLQANANSLLDDAVNYAAHTGKESPLVYAYKGLVGGFPGRFSIVPYYYKVQEYSNYERRDLWSYLLNLNFEEIDNLILALWEIGPHYSEYYYFDENCSYMLLSILEIARPKLLFELPHPWIIPADTVRTITNIPHLVEKISYRPSIRTRFIEHYNRLNAKEKKILISSLNSEPTPVLKDLTNLDQDRRIRLIDALLERIDYEEREINSEKPLSLTSLRHHLLATRSKLPNQMPSFVISTPNKEKPHRGHGTSRIGISAGRDSGIDFIQLHWRPALHDKMAKRDGYPQDYSIEFFSTDVRFTKDQNPKLEKFYLLSIDSLPSSYPLNYWAWNFRLGIDQGICEKETICQQWVLQGGLGKAQRLSGPSILSYAMTNISILQKSRQSLEPTVQPGLSLGTTIELTRWVKIGYEVVFKTIPFSSSNILVRSDLTLAYYPKKNWEWRMTYQNSVNQKGIGLHLYQYF